MICAYARKGVGLTELAVVLGIGLVLVALILPARRMAYDAAVRTQTMNNLKLLGLACHSYNDVHKALPAAHGAWPSGLSGTLHLGLAPYYEDNPNCLVNPADYSLAARQTPMHGNPYIGQAANFYLFGGPDPEARAGAPPYTPLSLKEIRDGSSNTLVFVTCFAQYGNGSSRSDRRPSDDTGPFTASLTWTAAPPASTHGIANANAIGYMASGIQVGLADGSARTISEPGGSVVGNQYGAAMLPADGMLPKWDY